MKLLLSILVILLTSNLFASQLKILANNFNGDDKKGVSVFSGHVRITRGSDELNASKVTVYTDTKHQPTKMTAEGHVSFYIKTDNNTSYKGVAEKVVYLPTQKEYQFYKDVHLQQLNNKREIDGDKIILNIINGKAVASGASCEPVTMIFHLKSKDTNKTK